MTDFNIWNDLDSTLTSLDVITSRLAGMQVVTDEGDWSVSDTISEGSSHDTWYEARRRAVSPAFTEDSALGLVVTPRSDRENRNSISSQSSSVGYHSNLENGALLSPNSDSKWTVSSPKSKVHFDEMNICLTKSPTDFDLAGESEQFGFNNDQSEKGSSSNKSSNKPLRGIVKSKTTIPITRSGNPSSNGHHKHGKCVLGTSLFVGTENTAGEGSCRNSFKVSVQYANYSFLEPGFLGRNGLRAVGLACRSTTSTHV